MTRLLLPHWIATGNQCTEPGIFVKVPQLYLKPNESDSWCSGRTREAITWDLSDSWGSGRIREVLTRDLSDYWGYNNVQRAGDASSGLGEGDLSSLCPQTGLSRANPHMKNQTNPPTLLRSHSKELDAPRAHLHRKSGTGQRGEGHFSGRKRWMQPIPE